MPMQRVGPAVERSRVNPEALRLALTAVMSRGETDERTRERRPLSISQVNRRTGVRHEAISLLLREGRDPGAHNAMALCAFMHLDPDLILYPPDAGDAAQASEPAA